ncbi:MAG: processing protein, partial [Chloroflexota bacterium]|nr:processing protein [Chloroflexota bacterium]
VLGIGESGPLGSGAGRPTPSIGSATDMTERDAWAVLTCVDGLGPVGFAALLGRYDSGVAILREASMAGGAERLSATPPEHGEGVRRPVTAAVAEAIVEASQRADRSLERIRALGLQVVTVADATYPVRLAAIAMPPHVLFVLGDPVALEAGAAVAVVGTRRATNAGRAIAARLATALVSVGATVVSGLATGIDGAAHAATIHARGTTIAVIGSGHAHLHPRIHERLAMSIVKAGGAVVSELAPDVHPTHGTFPRRNRVISGLADATVVVEAPARSGALITASWALEQGRECFLVPGPIGAPASAGCLAFLREYSLGGARIVAGIPQLIDDLGLADHLAQPGVSTGAAATLADVGEAAGRIGRELVLGRATVDELVAVTGWPVASVLAALTLLERRGLVVGVHGRFRPGGTLAGADPTSIRARPPSRGDRG